MLKRLALILILVFTFSLIAAQELVTVDSEGDVGQHTSITIGKNGFPVIGYGDFTKRKVMMALCDSLECENPTLLKILDPAQDVGDYTSVGIGASGFPVMAYYDYASFNQHLKLVVCNDEACEDATVTVVDENDQVGQYASLTIKEDGFPVISYYDQLNGDLKLAVCGNEACSEAELVTVDGRDGDVGLYTSIVIGESGFPVISYFDNDNVDLKLAVCKNRLCTDAAITTLNSEGAAGWYTDIALSAEGFPLVSYTDIANQDLKLVVCNDGECGEPQTVTVDDSFDEVGYYTSLAINGEGQPVISYYDQTNDDLRLAICDDTACGEATVLVLDGDDNVGEFASLTMSEDGFPIISYYDRTNGNLKLFVCESATCGT